MPPSQAVLTVGEVAAMVGVSPHTVRAWERRHQALAPERTDSHHRRYSMADVDLLRRVKQSVDVQGLSLKIAVAQARGLIDEPPAAPENAPPAEDWSTSAVPWRAVVDLLPRVVCVLDDKGRIVDANMAFARAWGVLRLDLPGRRFIEIVEPYDRAKAARLYRPRPQNRRGWELNLRTRSLSALFSFDSFILRVGDRTLLAILGEDLSSASMDTWTVLPGSAIAEEHQG